jgi:hypothetical protein
MTRALTIALLILIMTPLITLPTNASASTDYTLEVKRTVRIGEYGLSTVEDTFIVVNNSTLPLSEMSIGFPRQYVNDFRYIEARDSERRSLQVDLDLDPTSSTYWIRVWFYSPIEANQTYAFNVTSLFTGLIRSVGQVFKYRFEAAPTLMHDARSVNSTVIGQQGARFKLPPNSTFFETAVNGKAAITTIYRHLQAFANVTISVDYSSDRQFILRVPNMKRSISFRTDGGIIVSDSYEFFNPSVTISSIPIKLPTGATQVMAYDLVGAMWVEPRDTENVAIAPRYPGGIKTNQTFNVTLSYTIPRSRYVKESGWWGRYNFTFDVVSNNQYWLIENLQVIVTKPLGLTVEQISPQPISTLHSSWFGENLVLEFKNLTPLSDVTLKIDYRYSPFWAAVQPLTWIGLIEIVTFALAAVIVTRRPPKPEIPVPIEKIRAFVELYDENMALRFELDRMEEDAARGALTKHEYRRRRKTIDSRLNELRRLLATAKAELMAIHPRYDEMIRRMDRAEAEIDAVRASQVQVRSQYRTGRISRETFDALTRDLRKRMDKARQIIEATIISLREEAR